MTDTAEQAAAAARVWEPTDRCAAVVRRKGLQPILQPRLVMAMAVIILSFATLLRHARAPVQHTHPADVHVIRIWDAAEDKALRVKNVAVEYYESIRLIYQLERRLKDLQEQETSERQRETTSVFVRRSGQKRSDCL